MFNFVIGLVIVLCIQCDLHSYTHIERTGQRQRGRENVGDIVGVILRYMKSCLKTTERYNSAKSNYALFF